MEQRDLSHLVADFKTFLQSHQFDSSKNSLAIGYSGGVDSTLLLEVARLAYPSSVRAIHVNHHLAKDSNRWASFCQKQCEAASIPIDVFDVEVEAESGQGTEAAARTKRYQAFTQTLIPDEWLLLAHHANDQAETLLYRVLRGTGLDGLAGIPRTRTIGENLLLRPLLDYWRDEVVSMAKKADLSWIEDPSNRDISFDRNFIRHRVIPLINERWPSAEKQLVSLTGLASEQKEWIDNLVEEALIQSDLRKEPFGYSVSMEALDGFEIAKYNSVLRRVFKTYFDLVPSNSQLKYLREELQHSSAETEAVLQLGVLSVRPYRDRLYFLSRLPEQPRHKFLWDMTNSLEIRGLCRLHGQATQPYMATVSFRKGGERLKPLLRQHSQTLKKVLQEGGVEPWLRDLTPIISVEEEIAAFGDRILCSTELPTFQFEWLIGE